MASIRWTATGALFFLLIVNIRDSLKIVPNEWSTALVESALLDKVNCTSWCNLNFEFVLFILFSLHLSLQLFGPGVQFEESSVFLDLCLSGQLIQFFLLLLNLFICLFKKFFFCLASSLKLFLFDFFGDCLLRICSTWLSFLFFLLLGIKLWGLTLGGEIFSSLCFCSSWFGWGTSSSLNWLNRWRAIVVFSISLSHMSKSLSWLVMMNMVVASVTVHRDS